MAGDCAIRDNVYVATHLLRPKGCDSVIRDYAIRDDVYVATHLLKTKGFVTLSLFSICKSGTSDSPFRDSRAEGSWLCDS